MKEDNIELIKQFLNTYKNFKGELYPITFIIFAYYFGYIFGIRRFKEWKSSL